MNQATLWRKLAEEIRTIQVGAEEADLTATAATIDFAKSATVARLGEPLCASKPLKSQSARPGPRQTPLGDLVERQGHSTIELAAPRLAA